MIYNITLTTPHHKPYMRILKPLLNFFTPDSCIGCQHEGSIICPDCESRLYYPEHCVRCKKPSLGGLTCAKCASRSPISAFVVVSSYDGLAKKLITHMKYHPSPSSADRVGEILASKLPYIESSESVVTHIPTTPSRVRERGFDQSHEMAKCLANTRKLHFSTTLRRLTKSHQVGATKTERYKHMVKAFSVKNRQLFKDKTVVLVDDVMTTGATVESAARELKKAGASKVIVAVFARAE